MTTTLSENSDFRILNVASKTKKKSQILEENLNSATDKRKHKHVNKQYEGKKISNRKLMVYTNCFKAEKDS